MDMLHNLAVLLVLALMSGLGMESSESALTYAERRAVFSELLPYQYGGLYVNGDVVHVNVVSGKEHLVPHVDDAGIVYHEVEYTLAELRALMQEIQPLMGEFSIQTLAVDEELNRVVMELYKAGEDDKQRLADWLAERGANDMCSISETEDEFVVQ
jgi:hypothetical protein